MRIARLVLATVATLLPSSLPAAEAPQSPPPPCQIVSFAGLVGGGPGYVENTTRMARANGLDIEDEIARDPIQCQVNWQRRYVCTGMGYLSERKAFILWWTKDHYDVITPVDLLIGRRDVEVWIRRADAKCLDRTAPGPERSDQIDRWMTGRFVVPK